MEKRKSKDCLFKYSLILKVNVLLLFSYLSIINNDRIFTFIV